MRYIIAVLLAIVCVNALTTTESFNAWMIKHNKNYVNDAEFQYRLGVYRSNLEFIEEHNRMNVGFTVAMNKFGDLTASEFGMMYNTYRMAEKKTLTESVHTHDERYELPTSVDWRTKGYVTPVKDQGQCGSCWAFSTTGSVEGAHFAATGSLVSLSEQNLVDCSTSFGNYGCDGGLMDSAFNYIISNKGIDTEASYKYTARDGNCVFKAQNVGATISKFTDVSSGDENALASAVAGTGPVSVAIDASHNSFQFYSSGVYFEAACSSSQLDHGVLAVGYGTQSGSDFWIVKNSWGPDWGSSGYILMSRNKNNNCGIATMASYPTA